MTLAQTEGEVATLGAGAFFGEMSLLTGDPRARRSSRDRLRVDGNQRRRLRRVVLTDAAILERVAAAVETRRAELEQHRVTRAQGGAVAETPQTFVARVRQFLRLSG